MSPKTYQAYFLDLAAKSVAIAHSQATPRFAMLNPYELTSRTASLNYAGPIMLLDFLDATLAASNNDQLVLNSRGAFTLIEQAPRDDFAARDAAHQAMHALCLTLLSRMQYDQDTGLLPSWRADRSRLEPVGPLLDACYGYRCELLFTQHEPLEYDPDQFTS